MAIFMGTVPSFGNIIVAEERGFFEKERLPVQITTFTSGSVATEAFLAGRGNVVNCGDTPAAKLWTRGAGVGICPSASYNHTAVVVARKGINTPADMRGKKVGMLRGSSSEYFTGLYLASGNIDPKEVDIISLQPAEMVSGILNRDIDAFVLWEPFGTRATEASSDIHIVTTGKGYYDEWMINSTTPEYAKTNEAELLAFIRALDASSRWCNENRAESAEIVAKRLKLDIGLVRKLNDPMNWTVAYTPKFRKDMERLSQFLKLELNWEKMFDARLLRKANPALVS